MQTLNKRQIIVLAAFCLPLFALIMVSYMRSDQMPRLGQGRPVMANSSNQPPVSLLEARERIKAKLLEAKTMSAEQFAAFQRSDNHAAPTLEGHIARLQMRFDQLNKMTPDEWMAEERQRTAQLLQRGNIPPNAGRPTPVAPDLAEPSIPFPVQVPPNR